jgi:hypothetical protein
MLLIATGLGKRRVHQGTLAQRDNQIIWNAPFLPGNCAQAEARAEVAEGLVPEGDSVAHECLTRIVCHAEHGDRRHPTPPEAEPSRQRPTGGPAGAGRAAAIPRIASLRFITPPPLQIAAAGF